MRHSPAPNTHSPPNSIDATARGLLDREAASRHFRLDRFAPASALKDLVTHYWLVRWDLPGETDHTQQTLPHPSVHLVLDPQKGSGVRGVVRRSFEYRLQGKGAVFGVKFRPGAFSAFYHHPVQTLTDRTLTLSDFWGDSDASWERLLQTRSPEMLTDALNRKLLSLAPRLPHAAQQAGEMVATIEADRDLLTAEQVAHRANISIRTLQRLFKRHIGVSPKWVIDRYRMIEAVEALNRGDSPDLADLAYRLGYFDQAHFTRAFSALVGRPPSAARYTIPGT